MKKYHKFLYAFICLGLASLACVAYKIKEYSSEVDSVEYSLPAPAKAEACGSCKVETNHVRTNELNRLVQIRTQYMLSSKPTNKE